MENESRNQQYKVQRHSDHNNEKSRNFCLFFFSVKNILESHKLLDTQGEKVSNILNMKNNMKQKKTKIKTKKEKTKSRKLKEV